VPAGAPRANFGDLSPNVARAAHRPTGTGIYNGLRSPKATWADIEWIRETTSIPLFLKGVINPEDARLAVESGCDGVIVSNHGGRSLDTLPSTLEALPSVRNAMPSHIPVLIDGGIRRGTDVFKALALGATAVMIGRPYIHGLTVAGAEGVAKVVSLLQTEFEMTMGLTGCKSVQEITYKHIWVS
jgi:4-hydroxymandelate oxidase